MDRHAGRCSRPDRPDRPVSTRSTFRACVCGFLAGGMLLAGLEGTYEEVRLDTTGRAAVATVVATDLDSKAPSVTVHLTGSAPDVRAQLTSWRGDPAVGDRLEVTYAPGNPHLAKERGTFSWWDVVLPYPIAAGLGALCWDAVRDVRRRRREDPRRRCTGPAGSSGRWRRPRFEQPRQQGGRA